MGMPIEEHTEGNTHTEKVVKISALYLKLNIKEYIAVGLSSV